MHGGGFAQATINLVALRVGVDFIRADDALLNHACNHRMIACDLLQACSFAVEVGTAIADIGNSEHRANEDGGSDGRTHIASLLAILLIDGEIGVLNAFEQQFFTMCAIKVNVAQQCRNNTVAYMVDSKSAGLVSVGMTAHAVGNDEQAIGTKIGVMRMRSMHGEQVIFVLLLFARDAGVKFGADAQDNMAVRCGLRIRCG